VPPILLLLNPALCLVALAPVPLTATVSLVSGRMIRRASKESAEVLADANAFRIEVLSRIRTLKSLALESHIATSYREQLHDAHEAQVRGRVIGVWSGLLNTMIRAAGRIALAWFGWSAVLADDMTLGGYMAFMAYIGYVTGPISQMLSAVGSLQQLAVSLSRAFEYLDETPEQDPAEAFETGSPAPLVLAGRIEARGLRFAYGDGPTVLHDIDLDLGPGERIAVVGANGSGKSTLLRLLGLIDVPSAGRLLYDGRDSRNCPLRALRRQIMFVWQEPGLMRGSIRDNLMLGVPPEHAAPVEDAVSVSGLDELVSSLSDGLDTPIAEMGATLSGGQRQRLALGRAFLAARPVLLLDEATANIDVMSEMRILDALFERSGCVTAVYVTHRMASAAVADRIVCLDEGAVAGVGTHATLLSSCPTYAALAGSGGLEADDLIPIEARTSADKVLYGHTRAR
jgi:ABC-type bacteriocin/lantibiotic exporter with double-glycine peptidase domain